MQVKDKSLEQEGNVSPLQHYLLYIAMFVTFPLLFKFTDKSDLNLVEELIYYCLAGIFVSGAVGGKLKIKFFDSIAMLLTGMITPLVLMYIFYALDR